MEVNRIYQGDALEVLQTFPHDTFDLICTDPPYGYSFMGKAWDRAAVAVEYWKECLRVLKPGAFAFVMSAPRQDVLTRVMSNLEAAGFETGFTSIYWAYASGFPKATNMGKAVDKRLGNKRKIIGERNVCDITGGNYGQGKRPYGKRQFIETRGSSPLEGSYAGFQPKPALEVILVCMKPLSEKTYVEQALKNRKGVTWLDEGRIPTDELSEKWQGYSGGYRLNATKEGFLSGPHRNGRFPANLLVSDDALNIESTGGLASGGDNGNSFYSEKETSKSFSRYFDLDKWVRRTFPFLVVPKASKSEKGRGNHHPTVKPFKLMAYLIAIGSRKGDIVLDPFVGSGTTAVAAHRLGRRWVGIELDAGYRKLAERRLAQATKTRLRPSGRLTTRRQGG